MRKPEGAYEIKEFRKVSEMLSSMMRVEKSIQLEQIQIGQIEVEKYILKAGVSDPNVMLYLHGGGYVSGSYESHRGFVSTLCKKLCVNAYSINYGIAPENPYPEGLDDVFDTYDWMLNERQILPEKIIIAGDSSGGGLALALIHRLMTRNFPLPRGILCFSPWTDLRFTSETHITKADEDPLMLVEFCRSCADAYRNNADKENPEISPILADFAGFPPTFIQVGSREILLNDSVHVAEAMKEKGVKVVLDVWEGLFHAFLMFIAFPVIGKRVPEFKQAMNNVKDFVESL
jgi:epsilon-lactone hydrolase